WSAPVRRPNHGPWPPRSAQSVGRNPSVTAPNVGPLFFPQSRSLGIDLGTHSPHVLRKIVHAGAQNTSFASGSENLQILAGLKIPEKQVERLTKSIGHERVAQRASQVQAFLERPLMERVAAPAHAPDLAVVSMDGGRLQ